MDGITHFLPSSRVFSASSKRASLKPKMIDEVLLWAVSGFPIIKSQLVNIFHVNMQSSSFSDSLLCLELTAILEENKNYEVQSPIIDMISIWRYTCVVWLRNCSHTQREIPWSILKEVFSHKSHCFHFHYCSNRKTMESILKVLRNSKVSKSSLLLDALI